MKSFGSQLDRIAKRILDVTIASAAIVIVSPVLIYTAYKVKSEDGGPVLFRQQRAGKDNTTFNMYKFRSMKVGNKIIGSHADEHDNPYSKWNGYVPDDFVFKTTSSSNANITKTGLWIRKYSIDELPQLFNVLKGEMSIVGPRPEILPISKHYSSEQLKRLTVKPGITGWAQVNGRSDMNHGMKIMNDLWYVNNRNFLIDLKIIWMTFWQVLAGKGSV